MMRPLRAPATDRTVVSDPPASELPALLAENRERLRNWSYDFQGWASQRLRAETRTEVIGLAKRYTRQICDLPGAAVAPVSRAATSCPGAPPNPQATRLPNSCDDAPVIAAGHQPELFHAGVWVKNFAIDRWAANTAGVAVNLIVDNDTVKSATVRVPTGTLERPMVSFVPYDRWHGELPFEAYQVADEGLFESFGRRLCESVATLGVEPLARSFWPNVLAAARETGRLGERIAWARRRLESDWGTHCLELPIHVLCGSLSFARFAVHLLANARRFRGCYNAALTEYRSAARIRSPNHPMPDLDAEGDWHEAPFWVWHDTSPRRRHLFVRRTRTEIELTDREQWSARLPVAAEGDGARAAEVLHGLVAGGLRFRTRALTTTLFTRLLLADVFVHGIGGARYDRVANDLMRRFFGLEPPGFETLTGTLHLPVPKPEVTSADFNALQRRLRATRFNPDQFLEYDERAPWYAAYREKHELQRAEPCTRAGRRNRYARFRELNRILAGYLTIEPKQVDAALANVTARLEARAVLANREYPFCVHPAATLREFFAVWPGD